MLQTHSAICGRRPEIGWSDCVAIVRDSTASGSTINGESASPGRPQEPQTSKSATITERTAIMKSAHKAIHPGEILLEEFLVPLGISQYRLAQAIGVPPRRINEIVHGKRAISPDTALRLSRALGTSDRFWINLQTRYDLDVQLERHRAEFDKIRPLVA
jgi:antitoxin HigA-1